MTLEHGDDDVDNLDDVLVPSPPVLENLPVSPSEEFSSYGVLIRRMTQRLGISIAPPTPVVDDIVFDVVQARAPSAIAIPLSKTIMQAAKSRWDKPASVPVSNKRLDHLYRTQESNVEFLFKHPQPNSVIVSSSSKSCRHHSKGKKLDTSGRRLYSTGALGIRSYNYIACMSRYIHAIFKDLLPILQLVPDDSRKRALPAMHGWYSGHLPKHHFGQAHTRNWQKR